MYEKHHSWPMIPLLIAAVASLVMYFATVDVLCRHIRLGSPRLLALTASLLAFLGLARDGEWISRALALPYEALAFALLLLLLIRLLRGQQVAASGTAPPLKPGSPLRKWPSTREPDLSSKAKTHADRFELGGTARRDTAHRRTGHLSPNLTSRDP